MHDIGVKSSLLFYNSVNSILRLPWAIGLQVFWSIPSMFLIPRFVGIPVKIMEEWQVGESFSEALQAKHFIYDIFWEPVTN